MVICLHYLYRPYVSTYCTSISRTVGRWLGVPQRQRSSRHHNLPTPGDTIGNPSAAYREIKMLVTLREDPVPFLEVLLHSHLASRTCACEWLQLSCSLSGFHCVLVKDTSDQTRLLRYWGGDGPLTSIWKRLPSKGLARMPTGVAQIRPLSPLFGVTGPETSLYSKDHGHPSTEAEHCLWTLYKPMTKIHLSS